MIPDLGIAECQRVGKQVRDDRVSIRSHMYTEVGY